MDKWKQTNMTLTCLFIGNEKLARAIDEFPKRLKVHAETWDRQIENAQ